VAAAAIQFDAGSGSRSASVVMSIVSSTDPSASRDGEKRWFRRTMAFAAGLFGGVAMRAVIAYLAHKLMQEAHAAMIAMSVPVRPGVLTVMSGSEIERKLDRIRILGATTGGLLLICGLGFLFCFSQWLLAIRRRRAAEAAVFGPPRM
jgi:hypothetical protein